jgi:hypothetical protein
MKPLFRCLALIAALTFIAGARAQTLLIGPTDTWDYLHPTDGTDPAIADTDFETTWFTTDGSYNGLAFTPAAPGPFSYGGIGYFNANGYTGTLIGVNGTATAPPSGLRYTAYFKKEVFLTESYLQVTLDMLVDDGAIIYVDGVRRARVNMTGLGNDPSNGSGDAYTMLADGANNEDGMGTPVNIGSLSAGTHVIAISLHNGPATSSDLGLLVRMTGSNPPMLIRESGGIETPVNLIPGTSGWNANGSYAFIMNGPGGTLHSIESQPVDLSTAGESYFSMQLYCFESSTGSNFEPTDEFTAKLIVTLDDLTQTEIPLIPAELDTDFNGFLSGDEFNPGMLGSTAGVAVGRQLTAVIPENASFVSLRVQGLNDSTSEFYRFGAARISDIPFTSDEDGDGSPRTVELFTGTNPDDGADFFRMINVSYEYDDVLGSYILLTGFPAVAGKRYVAEETLDGGATWSYLGGITLQTTGVSSVYLDLSAAPPESTLIRIRCIP